ncbi:MAG: class I SAM-dependent methyltransferase [Thermoleophilaceae bacterium]|nr:class I SAM-dependent methyltransferase [Thermoleophilaceae bacterium]
MGIYDALFASQYDRFLAAAERDGLSARRERLLERARGRVLEIGAGTGLNLGHYPDTLDRLVLTEPSGPMATRLKERAAATHLACEIVSAPAEKLPFEDDSFDTVVSTLVLCTVPDQEATLAELRRVLAPGGALLLMEHVRSDSAATAKWQDRLERPWRWYGNGCRCNRDTVSTVEAAGFTWDELEHGRVPHAPPIVRPLIAGHAVMVDQHA